MNAIPPVVPGPEVDPTGRYTCPLCKAQRAGDEADTGWVACPMVRGRMICLGSCLDFQAVARASAFESHHDRQLFRTLARETQRDDQGLRATCLRHQLEVIDHRVTARADDVSALLALREDVSRALTEASVS